MLNQRNFFLTILTLIHSCLLNCMPIKKASLPEEKEIFNTKYEVIERVNLNYYGESYIATERVLKTSHVVYKINSNLYERNPKVTLCLERSFEKYLNLHLEGCYNIVEVIKEGEKLFIVYEIEEDKNAKTLDIFLSTLLESTMTEKIVADIILEILKSLMEIHERGFFHNHISPENIVVVNNKVRFKKFGMAQVLAPLAASHPESRSSRLYFAPEYVKVPSFFDERSDIWSCGVLCYMMLTGHLPFPLSFDETVESMNIKITNFNITMNLANTEFEGISEEGKDILRHLLAQHERRPSAAELIRHPWFEKVKSIKSNLELVGLSVSKMISSINESKIQSSILCFLQSFSNIEKEKENLLKIFQEIEKDKNGKIKKKAFLKFFTKGHLYFKRQECIELFNKLDKNKDKRIEVHELIEGSLELSLALNVKALKIIFQKHSIGHNNYLTREDLKRCFQHYKLESDLLRAFILEVDKNEDGRISYDEISMILKKIITSKIK